MKLISNQLRLSATDLSNHLACPHLTTLELSVARKLRSAPEWAAPDLQVIRELGLKHEFDYLAFLTNAGLDIVNLADEKNDTRALEKTLLAMQRGADVIYQGALSGPGQFGRPDILRKANKPSSLGNWSYEVYDCKLARETKATTILQLSFYSELLAAIQGHPPELMWVVVPGSEFVGEPHRIDDFAAYYRYVKRQLADATKPNAPENKTYPEPCSHCEVCRWFKECDKRRHSNDHLSLVAGLRRQQQNQLERWDIRTVAKLAAMPIPIEKRPEQGSREALERAREQARVQVESGKKNSPVSEPILPIVEAMGFCRLPEPTPHDLFLDFEGDPFVGENGLQYLTGLASRDAAGAPIYEKHWALNRQEEKKNFEWLIDRITAQKKTNLGMHVYHFGSYEPSALKGLMGMYATREDELDRILRAGSLVDLHQIFKQALRAGVEEYSLKKLEAFYKYERKIPPDQSRAAMRYIDHRLELGREIPVIPEEIRAAMEGYNREDCISTLQLQTWLEAQRLTLITSGQEIPRFVDRDDQPSEDLDERQKKIAALVAKLTQEIPADELERTEEQRARWLLAQLLDWHRREKKSTLWEGYRLADLDEEDLLDERSGLSRLTFVKRLAVEGASPTDQYCFEMQECEARSESELFFRGEKFGTVVTIDLEDRTVKIKKTEATADLHPTAVYVWRFPYPIEQQASALFRVGESVVARGIDEPGPFCAARELLMRKPPRLLRNETLDQRAAETAEAAASRIVLALDESTFAIQGPPGSGKTFTGARMICDLVKRGKRVGVTAQSHKVIHKLLDSIIEADPTVKCVHLDKDGEPSPGVLIAKTNKKALQALRSGSANVLGATSFFWPREEASEIVDVLFVDEAGQMSLADTVAVSQAAKALVLLGDPQQLDRPMKGSHPDGAEKSALGHLLSEKKTISKELGFFLPKSWRLHPKICKFTSEVFYESKLSSDPMALSRYLTGHPWLTTAGLWLLPVAHEANRNSSPEEVDVIERIVASLLQPEVKWFYSKGNEAPLKRDKDILIVAPYNAQVADLSARLQGMKIGTVDKFQGQEAPVVIYSLTTSSPEDAPRGMEFLYSLNRLNVATSRAKCNVIVVASPKLMEPDCRTPRQMQLANALCRYAEVATTITKLP
jgi:predicted RecB family nuclease